MDFICIGKYVNTHGLKGEIRILSDFSYKKKVFIPGFIFYLGKNKEKYIVQSYRKHKNFDMVTFKDVNDINLIEPLKGSLVYVDKRDIKLENNEILSFDLIGFNVIINDKLIGVIKEVIKTPANEVLILSNKVMIPFVSEFIIKVDKDKKLVFVNDVKGLI